MILGIREDTPMLPVHDAVAAKARQVDVAERAMYQAWCEIVDGITVEPRLVVESSLVTYQDQR